MDGNMANHLNQSGSKKLKWVLMAIAAIIIIGLGVIFGSKLKDFKMNMATTSEYQAVFLSNGQVYFGKLEHGGRWVRLKDVYYLQVTEPLQSAGSEADAEPNTTGTANDNKSEIKLVKLGSELHGPEDVMFIDPENILFWENMKEDSKVVESIKKSPAR